MHYSFKLLRKNRRRVKLQTLQFYINSKTIKLQRAKSVIILSKMVACRGDDLRGLFVSISAAAVPGVKRSIGKQGDSPSGQQGASTTASQAVEQHRTAAVSLCFPATTTPKLECWEPVCRSRSAATSGSSAIGT